MIDHKKLRQIVFIDGGRTPFLRSQTDFKKFSAYDLGRFAVTGLVNQTKLNPKHIDHLYYGNVIQDINTSNVAREISLASGLGDHIPSTTVSMACISSNVALTSAMNSIKLGQIEGAIVGGVEVMSDIPIRFRKKFRQKLLIIICWITEHFLIRLSKTITSIRTRFRRLTSFPKRKHQNALFPIKSCILISIMLKSMIIKCTYFQCILIAVDCDLLKYAG